MVFSIFFYIYVQLLTKKDSGFLFWQLIELWLILILLFHTRKMLACCKLIVEFFFFNFNLFFVWVEFNGFSMDVWIVVVVIDAVTVVPLLGYMLLFWCCVELSAFVAIFLFLSCRILLWLMLLLWNPLRIYNLPQTLRFERGIFRDILFSFGLLCEKLQWVVKSSGFLCIYMNQKGLVTY